MSKSKRARRRRVARTNTLVQEIDVRKHLRAVMGDIATGDYMMQNHGDLLQDIEFALIEV